jgi:NTP pyrophosphatase (non-canonical NTP hydrolase)
MINLEQMQLEHKEWAGSNFPRADARDTLLLLGEEAGELMQAYLKRRLGIRLTEEEANNLILHGVGDVLIALIAFCNKEQINIEDAVRETWDNVRRRDWLKDPVHGGEEPPGSSAG